MTATPHSSPKNDRLIRCDWAINSKLPAYKIYHDTEWGVPVYDDRKHFEFLILEGAQAGLSWETVLKKREGYRQAFAQFDPEKVALFTQADQARLKTNPAIIRNTLKIKSAIRNAQIFLDIQKECGSFSDYVWSFVDGTPIVTSPKSSAQVRATSPESDALCADLKRRGMKFVGSTIMYAHMQATGLINDHLQHCFRHPTNLK